MRYLLKRATTIKLKKNYFIRILKYLFFKKVKINLRKQEQQQKCEFLDRCEFMI